MLKTLGQSKPDSYGKNRNNTFFSDQYLNSHDLHVPIISYDFEEKSDSDQESVRIPFSKENFLHNICTINFT